MSGPTIKIGEIWQRSCIPTTISGKVVDRDYECRMWADGHDIIGRGLTEIGAVSDALVILEKFLSRQRLTA